jgi:cytochrome P450
MVAIEPSTRRLEPASLALIILAVSSLYLLGLYIYRRYFHPLARFPGPPFNSVSELPAALSLLRGRYAFDNKLHHERYGDVVRISPNELTFRTSQSMQDIYGFRAGHQNMKKSFLHTGPVKVGQTTTLQYVPSDADHGRQRRALSHAFSHQALMDQEPIVQDYMSKVVSRLRQFARDEQAVDICDWFNYFTFDTMGDLAFGESFGCLDEGKYQEWVDKLFMTIKDGTLIQFSRRIGGIGTWAQTFLAWGLGVGDAGSYHIHHTRQKVLNRLSMQDIDHRDFIWYILLQKEKGFELTQDEIIANAGLFIVAGSETTANALSGLIARLIWNPRVYEKLVSEIRGKFNDEAAIDFKAITAMPYLNAVIEEILRVHPPVPAGPPRVVPPGGDTIDGNYIPGGTTVSVGQWSACHSPAHFTTPDEFLPERWIDPAYNNDVKKAVQPFSAGPRNCLGKNLAYMEMRLVVAQLLWNFDIESADGAPLWDPAGEMKYKRAFMVWEKMPLMLQLKDVRSG